MSAEIVSVAHIIRKDHRSVAIVGTYLSSFVKQTFHKGQWTRNGDGFNIGISKATNCKPQILNSKANWKSWSPQKRQNQTLAINWNDEGQVPYLWRGKWLLL